MHHAVTILARQKEVIQDGPDAEHMVCSGVELPPFNDVSECSGKSFLWIACVLAGVYAAVTVLIVVKNYAGSSIYLCKVSEPSDPEPPQRHTALPEGLGGDWPQHVFTAAIEHTIPSRRVKVSAGGLGKVLDQMLREHPRASLSLLHPRFGDVDYGPLELFCDFTVQVDGMEQQVRIHKIEDLGGEVSKVWYLLDHPWCTELTKDAPYPYPMTKLSVLRFFSLWNQAAAALCARLQPDVYHCMDYHAALLPLYLNRKTQLPTIVVLHNADYDGAVETDFINNIFFRTTSELKRLSLVFNLKQETVRKYVTFEGRFNMLWGGIAYVQETQEGFGVCTVSGRYAAELGRERTMFKGLPEVMAIDNAIDPASDDGPRDIEALKEARVTAKAKLQEYCGLSPDPDAKILIFVGRWVKQKGVDHIALLCPSILQQRPEVQLVLAGPPGDPYGNYAQELLGPLVQQYKGRLFVVTEFFMIPKELRAGAHLCLMPSVSEPFGYVDVEFGLLGVPSLGCAVGGLGKMPGVYFRQQNSDSPDMMLAGFGAAVEHALSMEDEEYWRIAFAGLSAQFPFQVWRENLQECYRRARAHFKPMEAKQLVLDERESMTMLQDLPLATALTVNRPQQQGWSFRPRCPPLLRGLFGKSNALVSKDGKVESQSSERLAHNRRVAQQLQKLHVAEAQEFLTQPVTENRVRQIMREFMADAGAKETDADTLQGYISLADQNAKERNPIARALMRTVPGIGCLGIHLVIALAYILSPEIDVRLNSVMNHLVKPLGYMNELWLLAAKNIALAAGSLLWLYLSRAVPPNLLMLLSLFCSVIFYFAAGTLLAGGYTLASIYLVTIFSGVLGASRLLFLVWNFSEDFCGGFQVAAKRVAVVESLRAVYASCMQAYVTSVRNGKAPSTMYAIIGWFVLAVLVNNAPASYSSYVLPQTLFFRQLLSHKVYLLLTASLLCGSLASFAADNTELWMQLNGWTYDDIAKTDLAVGACCLALLPAIFFAIHKLSIWGPWAMRDISCLLPPGSLLRTLAFYLIGYMHYRSKVFLAILVFSSVIDVARYAAIFTAILSTLASKWYALIGGFLTVGAMGLCNALSPLAVEALGLLFSGTSPVFDTQNVGRPQVDDVALQQSTMAAVWPLALLAFLAQLLAYRYFVSEVATYKGHGDRMPDGSSFGPGSSQLRVARTGGFSRRAAPAATASLAFFNVTESTVEGCGSSGTRTEPTSPEHLEALSGGAGAEERV